MELCGGNFLRDGIFSETGRFYQSNPILMHAQSKALSRRFGTIP